MTEQFVSIRGPQNGINYQKRVIDAADYRRASESQEAHNLIGPNNVLMQINYGCYLRCQMCDRWEWTQKGADRDLELGTLELDQVFDQLATVGAKKITLVGTEPVIRSDLPEILSAIRMRDMKPEVYNSGIRMPSNVVDAVLKNSADVAFSVDGFFPESHNAIRWPDGNRDVFTRTVNTVHALRRSRDAAGLTDKHVRLTANMTLQDKNIDDLSRATDEDIDALGVDMLRVSLVHGIQDDGTIDPYCLDSTHMQTIADFYRRFQNRSEGRTRVSFSAGIKYISEGMITSQDFDRNILIPSEVVSGDSDMQCTIAEWSTMIDPEGNVYPCLYLLGDNSPYDDKSRHEYRMGNVKEQSFSDIWNGDRYTDFRSSHFPDTSDNSRCLTCEYVDRFPEMNNAAVSGRNQIGGSNLEIGW